MSSPGMVESLEQILSSLRHELGNSINSLKITLQVLEQNYDSFDDGKKKDYLKRGSELVARQERLIEAMRSYSRFQAKALQEIALVPLWDQILGAASRALEGKPIAFTCRMEVEPCAIVGNEVALLRAIGNILENAIEATAEVEAPKIEMRVFGDGLFIVVAVKDNGTGIRKGDMSRVFVPLFSTKAGKMGMGLPIASKLLHEMGGRIELASTQGEGTEATVWVKVSGAGEAGNHIT